MNQTNRDTADPSVPRTDTFLERTFDSYLGEAPLMIALSTAMFPAILTTTLLVDDPRLAVTLLYSIPIALFATLRGLRAGLIGATVSAALLVAVALPFSWEIGTAGYVVRLMTFYAIAVGVGWISNRLRDALATEIRGRRRAEDAHDSVIHLISPDARSLSDDSQADH